MRVCGRSWAGVGVVLALGVLGPAGAASAQDSDGPIVGTPPLEDAIPGWLDAYAQPEYYEAYVREVIYDLHFGLPWPFDAVKPEAFLANVHVPDGEYVSALPVDEHDLAEVTFEYLGEQKTVAEFLTTTRTDGMVFVHDGAVVDEYYANGYSPDVRHQPWSVTKTFVAAAIGVAVDEGHIGSLQDPIDAYIAELAGTAWESVTIENLLQMESGVHWDEGTPVLVVNTQVEQWVQAALDLHSGGAVGMTRNEFLASLPKAYEQGTEFRYNSGNTQVLAWLLETIYGQPFNEIISEKIWQPMGAAGDAMMIADREGSVIASQGLYARSHDFARFGELLRNGGSTPDGRQVVPANWVDAMTTMTDVSDGAYGYQTWAHETAGEGAYSASGFQGQKITVVPGACLTGVRLSHALGADLREGDDPLDPEAYRFADETFSEQWQLMLAAIADELGPCAASSDEVAPAPGVDPAPGDGTTGEGAVADEAAGRGPLPATGGGAAVAGLIVVLAATRRRCP